MNEPNQISLSSPYYRRMTDNQIDKIHNASLEILERVGVRFPNDEALKLFKEAGCDIRDGNIVHIPSWRVQWALNLAPKQILLYDQTGKATIRMTGRKSYYGNGSDLINIIDHKTEEHRKPVLQDLRDLMRLLDALPNFDFVMSGFLPVDVPSEKVEAMQTLVMLQSTNKPMVYVTTDLHNTEKEVAMFEAVAGGADEFRKRPFAACYINIAKPLMHNPESIEKLLFLSGKGLPFTYRPGLVLRSLTTPNTVAGFLAMQNAGGLAGLVLAQLKREGAPFIRCGCSGGTFDMKTSVGCHSAAEVRGFNEEIAHYYNLPTFGIGGTTESKMVDEQASMEAALTLLTTTLAGANLVHDVGYMESGLTGCLLQSAICNDILSWINHYTPGVEINDETLPLDLIEEIDTNGDYIQTQHTMRHFKEDEYPPLRDRQNYNNWLKKGGKSTKERARDQVEDILSNHETPKLDDGVNQKLCAIAETA